MTRRALLRITWLDCLVCIGLGFGLVALAAALLTWEVLS